MTDKEFNDGRTRAYVNELDQLWIEDGSYTQSGFGEVDFDGSRIIVNATEFKRWLDDHA